MMSILHLNDNSVLNLSAQAELKLYRIYLQNFQTAQQKEEAFQGNTTVCFGTLLAFTQMSCLISTNTVLLGKNPHLYS